MDLNHRPLGYEPKGSMLSPVESVALPRLQQVNNKRNAADSARSLHVSLVNVPNDEPVFPLYGCVGRAITALIRNRAVGFASQEGEISTTAPNNFLGVFIPMIAAA